MTLAIFIVGIIVFLITVYGTVIVGGMLLTERQLDDQPDLAPESFETNSDDDVATRARSIANVEF